MSTPFELEPRDDKRAIAARSQFYKILSGVFAYPSDEARNGSILRDAGEVMRDAVVDLPFDVPAIESLGQMGDLAGLAETYTRIFDNCGGRPALSLHEKDYSRIDTKQIWEELIRYYEHFGLSYDLEGNKEWPDHLGVELEFLHYVTFLETAAPDDVAEIYVAAAADFLERHLAKWVPKLAEKLAAMAEGSPYGALAEVLAQFIKGDAEFSRRRRALQ